MNNINPINSVPVTYTAEPLTGQRIIDKDVKVINIFLIQGVTTMTVNDGSHDYNIVIPNGMPLPLIGSTLDLKYVLVDYPVFEVEDFPTLFQYTVVG